ncbi:EamA/RhaT family transporter [Streptomyces sp. NBC_00582]|uniref:EamA/RhaT family transporter n=1 Tax=Streptomyces sp. NBC_00582 TaxID=2975783 RepID=UPI002E821E92|nr:EamA/RhaT family transporter [Streptomyces sp. NBC_00582]WUB62703.1 EamA/RhaT family transporter [Streptomyces sp. NBC_00582]
MSDENGTPDTPAGSRDTRDADGTQAPPADGPAGSTGPRPEPLRFFGTTWVEHDQGYIARRCAVAAGALAATVGSCLVLRFAYQGVAIAETGGFVTLLVVVMFAICSALAFRTTWDGFSKRPDPDRQASLRGLLAIGFVGSLAAYFLRALAEAPGEKLHREEYESALEQHRKRTSRRTGNPSKKRRRS